MATSSLAFQHERAATGSSLGRYVAAGLTVAFLDGLFAVAVYDWLLHKTTATRVFQSIAAGLLGKDSYNGGTATVVLGVACHLVIAFGWTTLYFVASRRIGGLRQFASTNAGNIMTGLLYGAFIWLAMDFVVLPLSATRSTPPTNWQFWLQLAWHIVGLGPPLVRILR